MLKRTLLLTLSILTLWIYPAHAQEGPDSWSAWLYDPLSGRLVLIAADGSLAHEFTLPVSQGFNLLPYNVAVSRSGSLMAFIAANSDTSERQLIVYEPGTMTQRLSVNLPPIQVDSLSIRADMYVFNEADTGLAVGYLLADGRSQIDVYDLTTGAVAYSLPNAGPVILSNEAGGQGTIPVVQRFEGSQVIFSLVPAFTEGQPEYSSFGWDVLANSVDIVSVNYTLDNDTLASTNEVIMAAPYPQLPNHSDLFAYFQTNALAVFDGSAYYPFYNDPDRSLFWPRFVQNGERILIAGSTPDSNVIVLSLIERSGAVVNQAETVSLTSARGVTDGYIFTTYAPDPGGTIANLIHVNTREGQAANAGTVIWRGQPGQEFRIVWATDRRVVEAVPFTPWTQLAPPIGGH
jgi:hypothetical protein